jgi:hypothetical protein
MRGDARLLDATGIFGTTGINPHGNSLTMLGVVYLNKIAGLYFCDTLFAAENSAAARWRQLLGAVRSRGRRTRIPQDNVWTFNAVAICQLAWLLID